MRMRMVVYPVAAVMTSALLVANANAFEVIIHREITHIAPARVTALIAGSPRTFSERALQQLEDANEHVDDLATAAYRRPELHFTNEEFNASTALIIKNKKAIVDKLKAPTPDGDAARKLLGQTLHTIQDFYSHSNWVEQGNAAINANFGRNVVPNPPPGLTACPADISVLGLGGGGGTTSGYYIGLQDCTIPPARPGKCAHGTWDKYIAGVQVYKAACFGINKDLNAALAAADGVPLNPGHAQARALAEAATQDFVQQVVDELKGNDAALSALMDVKGSIGFVVDTTGSMGGVIGGVKTIASGLVSVINRVPSLRPDRWIVEPFNDPGIGPITVSTDVNVINRAINALFANGGGDCPELSQGGIDAALDNATTDSNLFIFTDASAKDSNLQNQVISKAQNKKTRLTYLLNGSCSPIDSAYIRGAAETGGQVFLVNETEIPQLQTLIQAQLSTSLASISSIQGTLTTTAVRQIALPVDTSIASMTISASLTPGMQLTLKTPNGTVVDTNYPNAQIINLSGATFITVDRPVTGTWGINVTGAGDYSLTVSGNSPLALNTFDIVVPNRDIHGGYNPIGGNPLLGSTVTAIAKMVGPYSNVKFDLVDESGALLRTLNLVNDPLRVGPGQFIGEFAVPSRPFRVLARGNNTNGAAFQRELATVIRAQPVDVSVEVGATTTVVAGVPTPITFIVKNSGEAATFSVQATDTADFITSTTPTTLALGKGASARVQVNVLAPSSMSTTDSADTVTLVVTNVADQTQFNRAAVSVNVFNSSVAGDVNGDGLVNCSDIGIVRQAFGQKAGQLGYDARADVTRDNVIDIRDLSFVSQRLPAGTVCQ